MTDEAKLKPCAHCGNVALIIRHDDQFSADCGYGYCGIRTMLYATATAAAAAWNRRAQDASAKSDSDDFFNQRERDFLMRTVEKLKQQLTRTDYLAQETNRMCGSLARDSAEESNELRQRIEKLEQIIQMHDQFDLCTENQGRIAALERQVLQLSNECETLKRDKLDYDDDRLSALERQVSTACLVTGATESRMSTLERKFAENFYDRFGETPVEPEPQKEHVAERRKLGYWLNIYRYNLTAHDSREEADTYATNTRIACKHIVAVEGEGI